jgi:UDP-N-acetylglucosamine 2-epimerase (non-hydrolysing)
MEKSDRARVMVLFGTRPEAIKMAPLIHELRRSQRVETTVCFTGQHRTMVEQVLGLFDIRPDIDLDVMTGAQSLESLTAALMTKIPPVYEQFRPDAVLVQGDTTTTFVGALAAFYKGVRVGHVEAGLRTGDLKRPWPEEANRRMATILAWRHFTPTAVATGHLRAEGVPEADIAETGNTVVDALLDMSARLAPGGAARRALDERFAWLDHGKRMILVTGHRRENFGDGFRDICAALRELARMHADVEIVYPVHLNPSVQEPVRRMIGDVANIKLIEPVAYDAFVYLMQRSHFILTDSGGVQEEAPTLGKPLLVMRETSERMEGIEAGCAKLVTTRPERIVAESRRLLEEPAAYSAMARPANPFGDGHASARIVSDLLSRL